VINRSEARQPKVWIAVALAISLVGIFVLSLIWSRENEWRRMVITGNAITPSSEIEARLKEQIGKNMTTVSLQQIEDTLRKLPFIRQVIATKELPDAVRIKVEERRPVAIMVVNGNLKLIDEDGFVLKQNQTVMESARFPKLTGFNKIKRDTVTGLMRIDSAEVFAATQFCRALSQTRYAKLIVREINVSEPKKMYAVSANGNARFIFGNRANYDERLKDFESFWREVIVKKGTKNFDYVDLRFEGKIFAKEFHTVLERKRGG
jgi:cell division protein FtsQ